MRADRLREGEPIYAAFWHTALVRYVSSCEDARRVLSLVQLYDEERGHAPKEWFQRRKSNSL